MAAGENVLAVALAAGIPLPHSCRQGLCGSCRARLLSGTIAYPDGKLPPGLSAGEASAGAVLLCQARPCSPLVVETRLARAVAGQKASGVILAIEPLVLDALLLRLRLDGSLAARPGQFIDAVSTVGLICRLPLIARREGEIDLEATSDGSAFREWLSSELPIGASLLLRGPFDAPR